jgi:iron complex outermembrane receptor protein
VKTAFVSLVPALCAIAVPLQVSAVEQSSADHPQQTQSTAEPVVLEQVVVTATKVETPLQKLPEAVTAISAEQLQDLNAQTFEDYFRTVPGLMMNGSGAGLNRFDFSLRGVSDFSQLAPVQNATVGQYLDEIPVTAVGQQIDPRLVDIERIEVLRGPQGTYFGEDSLGGTIRIITRKPDLNDFSGSVDTRVSQTRYGGTNDSETLMVNLPIVVGKLGFRANYYNADDSGFIDGVTAGCTATGCNVTGVDSKRINPDRSNGARAMLLFEPVDRVSLLGEYIHSDYIQQNTATYEPKVGKLYIIQNDLNSGSGPSGGPPPGGGGTLPGGGTPPPGGVTSPPGGGGTPPGGGTTNPGGGGLPPGAPSGDLARATLADQDNLYNFTANVGAGPVDLVSVSSWGYRTLVSAQPVPGQTAFSGIISNYDTFTQELRAVSSKGWSERWDYILGLYLQRYDQISLEESPPQQGHIGQSVRDKAIFGEAGFKFTDRWSARLGLRNQTVDFNDSVLAPGAAARTASAESGKNTPTTGRVLASYDFNNDAMMYGSISRGFRKGGLNQSIDSHTGNAIPGVPSTFGADTTTNYELGWKLKFEAMKATLDGALYHISWQNIQVAQVANLPGNDGQQQYFLNAGAAKVDGLELESALELAPGLRGQLSFSVMNPVMTENQPGAYTTPVCERGCPARAGDEIPFVARVTGSATLTYRHALGAGVSGFVTWSEQYTGQRNTDFSPTSYTGVPNVVFIKMSPDVLANLQAGVERGGLRVSVYADNLFDRHNVLSATPSLSPPGTNNNGDEVLIDRPLTVGLWVRYSIL